MNLGDDHFTLFGMPARQALDRAELDARRRDLQARVHPDQFASEGAATQRTATHWAVRVNEAYACLKDPLARAAYLCEQRGVAVDAERNTAMPAAFLMQQMAWREALEDAEGLEAIERLDAEITHVEAAMQVEVTQLLDQKQDTAAAAGQVRALMFVARFRHDISRRLEALDSMR